MDLNSLLLSGLALIFLTFITDLTFLALITFCLSVSYFIEAQIKGIHWKDSFYGSASVVLIIVRLIVACFGCFLLPQNPAPNADNSTDFQNLSSNNSLFSLNESNSNPNTTLNESITVFHQISNSSNLTQNLTKSDLQPNNPNPILNALGLGLGVIGVGVAFFAYGLGNITTIESKRDFQELKVYVMEGPYFAQKFKRDLIPMDYLKIFGFWAVIGIIIIVTNFSTAQSTYLVLIRFFIGLILLLIGILAICYGLIRNERDLSNTIQTVLTQLRSR